MEAGWNIMVEPLRDDFDSPWKDLLEKYFQQFMEFFSPRPQPISIGRMSMNSSIRTFSK